MRRVAKSGTVFLMGASIVSCSSDPSPVAPQTLAVEDARLSIEVAPAELSMRAGEEASLTVLVQASGSPDADPRVSWRSQDDGVARVSDAGQVAALSAGDVYVIAELGHRRDSALVRVSRSLASPSDEPSSEPTRFAPVNLPAGYSRIAETSFESVVEGFNRRSAVMVTDHTAPVSCCSVAEKRYTIGDVGGGAVAMDHDVSSARATSVYVAAWVKFSGNFRNHSSRITKIFYAWSGGRPKMVLTAYGPHLELRSLLRHAPGAGGYEPPNRASGAKARLRRGKWHLVEYVVESASTPGGSDGAMRWWLDGELVGDYRGLATHGTGETLEWDIVEWNTIWGGTGDRVTPADGNMYVRASHFYIAGRR